MNKEIYSEGHKELVEKLIKARKKRGLSQIEVAGLLGRSQSYVSKVEAGQRRISVTQLREFAKIYKTDISYFIAE